MATSAAAHKARAPKNSNPESSPRRWWQWVLVYPTVAMSLVSASPQWFDWARAKVLGVNGITVAEAEKQNLLWKKNLPCTVAPFSWTTMPNNVKVDATICPTGDILVRANSSENLPFFKWLPLEDVLRSASGTTELIPKAQAATLNARIVTSQVVPMPALKLAMLQVNVICQHFIDNRYIKRRVATPQGCFDEVIDTFNGTVVSRNPAPCNPQC